MTFNLYEILRELDALQHVESKHRWNEKLTCIKSTKKEIKMKEKIKG